MCWYRSKNSRTPSHPLPEPGKRLSPLPFINSAYMTGIYGNWHHRGTLGKRRSTAFVWWKDVQEEISGQNRRTDHEGCEKRTVVRFWSPWAVGRRVFWKTWPVTMAENVSIYPKISHGQISSDPSVSGFWAGEQREPKWTGPLFYSERNTYGEYKPWKGQGNRDMDQRNAQKNFSLENPRKTVETLLNP